MNGFMAPNYTQVPNLFLDDMAKEMGEAELRVALVIMRETFGWHRESKKMSLSYFEQATGLTRQGVINGVKAGLDRGIFWRKQNGSSYEYGLVVNEVDQNERSSQRSRPEVVNEVDTTNKEKEISQKVLDLLRGYYKSQPLGNIRNHVDFERKLDEHVDVVNEYGFEEYQRAAAVAVQYKDIRYANNIEAQIVRDRAANNTVFVKPTEPVEVDAAWIP